jgi:hypothetical protein
MSTSTSMAEGLSTYPEGMTKSPGAISSRNEPTAEKATIAWTPMCFRAAMLARTGTSEGEC